MKRLRKNRNIRNLMAETSLSVEDFILPYFVVEGENKKEEIESMPGVYHFSIDNLVEDLSKLQGIKSILLFGVVDKKDESGSKAFDKNGLVQNAIRRIKGKFKDLIIITDVCLCGYTSHGHCGIVRPQTLDFRHQTKRDTSKSLKSGVWSLESDFIDHEKTLETLAKIAVSHAEAGADFVAPSAMMDGQVKAIRKALDKNRYQDIGILGYSAKYASNFYGPFREALHSAPKFGDRKSYQMDFRNSDEALREIKQDIDEGADIVMVKPALAYLDIIYRAKQKFNIPIAAYNVSGEYSMVKAYCQKPVTSNQKPEVEKNLVLEILTAIKRAGADIIITYFAKDVVEWLRNK